MVGYIEERQKVQASYFDPKGFKRATPFDPGHKAPLPQNPKRINTSYSNSLNASQWTCSNIVWKFDTFLQFIDKLEVWNFDDMPSQGFWK